MPLCFTPGRVTACVSLAMVFWSALPAATTINGFAVDRTSVPAEHIVRAAAAKDSIPALDATKWIAPAECTLLGDDDEVLSLTLNGETRAYPLRMMVWHEVINDQVGDTSVLVTYSALSGSAMAFAPGSNADGTTRTFGVSGLLYNSCLLMYDRATECLWSQLRMSGISGDAMDVELKPIAARRMTWLAWKTKFPEGKVLSTDTGHSTDYAGEWPYGDYADSEATIFPFDINRDEFSTKDRMIAMKEDWAARAWPLKVLKQKKQLFDAIGSRPITVAYNEDTDDVEVSDISTGEILPVVSVYWFAWQAFYPETSVYLPLK